MQLRIIELCQAVVGRHVKLLGHSAEVWSKCFQSLGQIFSQQGINRQEGDEQGQPLRIEKDQG